MAIPRGAVGLSAIGGCGISIFEPTVPRDMHMKCVFTDLDLLHMSMLWLK